MVFPIGCLNPRYFTHASLMMKAEESLRRDGSKSRPSLICQPTVFPNSGDMARLLKFSCKPGSLPSHLKPPLLGYQSLIFDPDLDRDATTPLASSSFLTTSDCLPIMSFWIGTVTNPVRL